jgi:hypothetical protein
MVRTSVLGGPAEFESIAGRSTHSSKCGGAFHAAESIRGGGPGCVVGSGALVGKAAEAGAYRRTARASGCMLGLHQ